MNRSFILSSVLLLAGVLNLAAADKAILVRTCIYAVPKKVAHTLLAAPAFTSDAQAATRALRGMVAEKKASIAANPSASSILGTRTAVAGDFIFKFESTEAEGGAVKLVTYVEKPMKPAAPKIFATLTMKRGETQFLGSCDDPSSDPNAPAWMVFATLQ